MSSRLGGGGAGSATTDASLLTTGTLPLARLSGITSSQLDAAAGITSGQIAALAAAKITTGTLPLARLSGITTTQLSASAGILGSQLDAAAAIASGQIAALDAAKITTGTLPLGRLSGITTSQLAAGAAITSGQIASVAAATITGTNTLPDGVLSTNVPLLASANTFTAAQTISASVAGPLAQINNSSTTGAGLVIGSTTVASAGAGKIAPALAATQVTPATANYGLVSIGGGPWDGSTSGFYNSSSSGSLYAGNAASGFGGNLIDLQVAGASKVKVDSTGAMTVGGQLNLSNTISWSGSNPVILATGGSGSRLDFKASNAANVVLCAKGTTSQTGDLLQARDSADHPQFGVMNSATGGSPVWALRVRATANSESMAQAHVVGAATGKAIQVFDDAGTSLGYIALYA